jgi:hypothetical protein
VMSLQTAQYLIKSLSQAMRVRRPWLFSHSVPPLLPPRQANTEVIAT